MGIGFISKPPKKINAECINGMPAGHKPRRLLYDEVKKPCSIKPFPILI